MSGRVSALLEEILASAAIVRAYVESLSKDEFIASIQLQDAVVRRIEIIGEGVKNIPQDWRDRHPDIPWRQIARMRDVLIHRYFSVDLEVVWQAATHDVPELQRLLSEMLAEVRHEEAAPGDAPQAEGGERS